MIIDDNYHRLMHAMTVLKGLLHFKRVLMTIDDNNDISQWCTHTVTHGSELPRRDLLEPLVAEDRQLCALGGVVFVVDPFSRRLVQELQAVDSGTWRDCEVSWIIVLAAILVRVLFCRVIWRLWLLVEVSKGVEDTRVRKLGGHGFALM